MAKDQHIRYLRLNQVFDKALAQSLTKLENWEKLCSCFPNYSLTREGASNLQNCQKQVIEFWTELCRREFEEILVERNVKDKLDELDDLICEAKERLRKSTSDNNKEDVQIDELSSEQLVQCNLYGERIRAISDLDDRLKTLNSLNENLRDELQQLESELNQDQKEITRLCDVFVGKTVENSLDETLVQGLSDMLLELREG